MGKDELYMQRCLELALNGLGKAAPNPMVGCVIVYRDKIIGEGFHRIYGGPHAEVNAINNVKNKSLLKESKLYVNLEPCSHYGKTPPCSDYIIKHEIPEVIISNVDPNPKVMGRGIKKMQDAGIKVKTGVKEKDATYLNRRFFGYHNMKRPYVILKWAQTFDGFIDYNREVNFEGPNWITNPADRVLVHKWRSEEQAILIGTNTAIKDNPMLNVRDWKGNDPVRCVIDLNNRLPENLKVFDGNISTIVFTLKDKEKQKNLDFVAVKKENLIEDILVALYNRGIISIIIEGGAKTIESFIKANMWDEARVFTSETYFKNGIQAPILDRIPVTRDYLSGSSLSVYFRERSMEPAKPSS
jgi:diaminohydroxyphosphoribosylaminopyrimidine deaminase/5-amino-6-(5-phosphoribosylamino)uracil reductase